MKKYLFYEKESETRATINLIYNVVPPQELLDDENWIKVDELPKPEPLVGKSMITVCNPVTQEIWYEYEDIPKSPEVEEREAIKTLLLKINEEREHFKLILSKLLKELETQKVMNSEMMLVLVDADVV